MEHLNLRLRVFLFFCLIALGGSALVFAALMVGYRQSGDAQALSPFVTAGVLAGFGLLALTTFVWRLFDENVAKPIQSLAGQFRIRADSDIDTCVDAQTARYLGDLGPAATAISAQLGQATRATAETVAQKTARLERQRAQLLRILSDIPVAVIVASPDHKIVLYDGQAADLMEREAPARLNGCVTHYLEGPALFTALDSLKASCAQRAPITLNGLSGEIYSGHIRLFGGNDGYMLMLEPLAPEAARPLVYDFDLLEQQTAGAPDKTGLRDLNFVVFDSETTGLDPARDKVVQLGAVRIVNGRVIASERFEMLVNPGCPIPAQSTRVHRITDAMVAGAPDFETARTAFRAFAGDAVLVAHNAPFDMAFLNAGGMHFDNRVMDTVHLSAIVFGGAATHTLDALCDRLGIEIPEALRHTALGDAMATAEVLTALLPILEGMGLKSFEQVRTEALKHRRILEVHS